MNEDNANEFEDEIEDFDRNTYDPELHGASYEVPDGEIEADATAWHGYMPPIMKGGKPIYIEGVYPNTQLTRQALEAVRKKDRREPLIGLKEGQENLIRLCVKKIGTQSVTFGDLRGKGLDKYLTSKQMHFVIEMFDRFTTPDEADVEDFMSTVQTGRRKA
jgi:hypothetical protein